MGIIKNFDELATDDHRRIALGIAEAGFSAIGTERAIERNVRRDGEALALGAEKFDLKEIGDIVVIGIGKCAVTAGLALERILGERISRGVILGLGSPAPFRRLQLHMGTHPFPSPANVKGAEAAVEVLKGLHENDLVIFVISGGGSTLLCLPDDRGCEEEEQIMQALFAAGATIQELNVVRKHLSTARGGYLAEYAYPARSVSLVFSDVPGDDLQFIASGPTVMDATTVADAKAVLVKYDILRICGIAECGLVETPKDPKYFTRATHEIIVSNRVALEAMADAARAAGLSPEIRTTALAGEAHTVGESVAEDLRAASPGTALLYGGETTVTLDGPQRGKGGRNLEVALSAARLLREGETVVTVASDGRDNGEYAGAICDIMTLQTGAERGLDPVEALRRHDTYPFFDVAGGFLLTGPTGANVSDLIIAIKH